MTISTISDAYDRISTADPSSPLALFRAKRVDFVDVMFANTVYTQQRIQVGDINHLGTFHRDNMPAAREVLAAYAESAAA